MNLMRYTLNEVKEIWKFVIISAVNCPNPVLPEKQLIQAVAGMKHDLERIKPQTGKEISDINEENREPPLLLRDISPGGEIILIRLVIFSTILGECPKSLPRKAGRGGVLKLKKLAKSGLSPHSQILSELGSCSIKFFIFKMQVR